ncbi:hypothetical protein MRX96_013902 [Rhipicephalus microplus]
MLGPPPALPPAANARRRLPFSASASLSVDKGVTDSDNDINTSEQPKSATSSLEMTPGHTYHLGDLARLLRSLL